MNLRLWASIGLTSLVLTNCGAETSLQESAGGFSGAEAEALGVDPEVVAGIADTYGDSPINIVNPRSGRQRVLPAGRKFRASLDFPLNIHADPRVPAHYRFRHDFTMRGGGDFEIAPTDRIQRHQQRPEGAMPWTGARLTTKSCPVTAVALRATFALHNPENFMPRFQRHSDPWHCVDAVIMPYGSPSDTGARRGSCRDLVNGTAVGETIRYCAQYHDGLVFDKATERTFHLGPYVCPNGEDCGQSYTEELDIKLALYEAQKPEIDAELQTSLNDLHDQFERFEIATDRVWEATPFTREGRVMAAQHLAFSTFAFASGGLDLKGWKGFLFDTAGFAAIGAATQVLDDYTAGLESGGEMAAFVVTSRAAKESLTETFRNREPNAQMKPGTQHFIGVLAFSIAALVIDWRTGKLDPEIRGMNLTEDIADRLFTASLAVVTWGLAKKFGPLAGVLRTELTILWRELHAFGKFGYFMWNQHKFDRRYDSSINMRHLSGSFDKVHTKIVYELYLREITGG